MPDPDIISTSEAAALLKVHPATINRWVLDGKLTPQYEVPGKTGPRFYKRTDVEALLPTPAGDKS